MAAILDQYGKPMESSARQARVDAVRKLAARYDAAATTDDNRRHWANADMLSADAANSPDVRARLRSRCRYEVWESNAFANGIVRTLANYLIGPGPRLQMQLPDRASNIQIQRSFSHWARLVRLPSKLRTMRMSKATDGEGVAAMSINPRLPHRVQLDLRLREADQMATPDLLGLEKYRIDGVDFDEYENPLRYWFLEDHPGSNAIWANPLKASPVDARHVIHWFRQDRPGQHRGIPELAPALPLFAMIRRYVIAVIAAAESAADFAAVMYSDGPAVEPADVDPMDAIELEMRAMLTLPKGWKLGQIKAEQPTTTFEMFRNCVWNEAARCVLMPFNIAAGNSAGYNFASGRLDHQAFDLAIDTDRADCEMVVLEPLFTRWLTLYLSEASGIAPSDIDLSLYPHRWYWPPREHVDPQKAANATLTLWNAGLISDDDIFFEGGSDPEEKYEALERQYKRRRAIGMPLPAGSPGPGRPPEEDAEDRREREEAEGELEEAEGELEEATA